MLIGIRKIRLTRDAFDSEIVQLPATNLAPHLAMKIDGEYNFRWITTGKLIRMGIKAGLSERIVKMEIQKIRKRLNKVLLTFTDSIANEHPASIYLKIQAGIQERFNQLIVE